MRILHVFDHSLPERSGYSLRSAAILREQRRLGWETAQVTGPKHTLAAPARESIEGFDFYRTVSPASALARLPAVGQLDVVRRLRSRLKEIIRLEEPDVLHAHSPCLNGLAALGLGKPLLYELRSSWEDAAVSSGLTT
ncbi:MAG TPA: glycosyltransferase, partial [Steroidobacteraceae bacterium]